MSDPSPAPIIIHVNPDLDCITGAWLLQRYGGMADHPIVFVNTGSPDPDAIASAAAVVDTGREYDMARRRFDHHHNPELPSAAALVYGWLIEHQRPVQHLQPLVMLVDAADRGQTRDGAAESRSLGLHALVGGFAQEAGDDQATYGFACAMLDLLDRRLLRQQQARDGLAARVRWISPDGLVIALADSTSAHSRAAEDVFGARLIVWSSAEVRGGVQTYGMGCSRGGGAEVTTPHVGDLVGLALEAHDTPAAVATELACWYRHPAGFMAASGTAKAPRTDPPQVDVSAVAQVLDRMWTR